MPIPFTCPHCGEQTLADDRYAGHEGPCVNCGWTVTVPSDAPRTEIVDTETLAGARTRERAKSAIVAMAAIALLGFFL